MPGDRARRACVHLGEAIHRKRPKRAGRTAAGVKHLHVHGLRHSHASYLIHRGANIALISKRLGHEKVSTTLDTYMHFFPSDEHSFIDQINADLSDN